VELFARAGEGRAELQGVTPETDIETLAPQLEACFERADGRVALTRRQLDGTAQTAISYVDDMGTALLHAVQSLLEVRNDFGGTVNQAVAVEQVERGNAGCAGHRVGRVGVAMGEFHHVFGEVLAHEGVVDLAVDHHGPHGDGAVGHLLRDAHDVGGDTEEYSTVGGAHEAEGGEAFVKDQQDVVLVTNVAPALQVALGRNQHTRRAGHGLDNDGGDIRCGVQLDQLEQFVRQLDPTRFRLAAREGQTGLQGVGQVID